MNRNYTRIFVLSCRHIKAFLPLVTLQTKTLLPPCAPPPLVAHEHLKERGLFGLPPPPPRASPSEYYHLMAGQRSPYGEGGGATGGHLSDYTGPLDGE